MDPIFWVVLAIGFITAFTVMVTAPKIIIPALVSVLCFFLVGLVVGDSLSDYTRCQFQLSPSKVEQREIDLDRIKKRIKEKLDCDSVRIVVRRPIRT